MAAFNFILTILGEGLQRVCTPFKIRHICWIYYNKFTVSVYKSIILWLMWYKIKKKTSTNSSEQKEGILSRFNPIYFDMNISVLDQISIL